MAANTNFVNLGIAGNTFRGDGLGTMDPICGTIPAFISDDFGIAYSQEQPFAGIFLENSTFNIGTGATNTFDAMANGIWMEDVNAGGSLANQTGIRNCAFSNMTTAGFTDDSGNGVRFNDFTGGHTLEQTNSIFNNCRTGVFDAVWGPGSYVLSTGNNMGNTQAVQEGYRFVVGGSILSSATMGRPRVTGNNVTSTRFGLEFNVTSLLGSNGGANQLDVRTNTFNATTGHGVILRCDNDNAPVQQCHLHRPAKLWGEYLGR